MRTTSSALKKLGERLRAGPPRPEDLRDLNTFRDEHLTVIADLLTRINQQAFAKTLSVTARQKSIPTILEKLQRQRTALPRMRDIAGARLVLPAGSGLDEQSEVVKTLRDLFPRAVVIDRVREPSAGYRAIHLEIEHDGYSAEIQVRTFNQDLWAQVFERLGDTWGRQIRYGKPPTTPDAAASRGSTISRAQVLAQMKDLSLAALGAELSISALASRSAAEEIDILEMLALGAVGVISQVGVFLQLQEVAGLIEQALPLEPASGLVVDSMKGERDERPPYFVVGYRRASGILMRVAPFVASGLEDALTLRSTLEEVHAGDPDLEVVLLSTRSEQELKTTHARFFRSARDLVSRVGEGLENSGGSSIETRAG